MESRGGATVYRFAASSVRRAFDAGWSATEVHDFVSSTSRTPVPQSLTYLVDDVSRRFGTLRAGHAEAFLRSDDETALTELMHASGADSLRLRRIAPTVVISDLPLGALLPASANSAGTGCRGRGRHRPGGPSRRLPRALEASSYAGGDGRALGGPDRGRGLRDPLRRPLVRVPTDARHLASSPADVIAMLRQAAESDEEMRIGYVGNDGTVAERLVNPERVEGGRVSAYDERSDSSRTFAIHRITAVSRP